MIINEKHESNLVGVNMNTFGKPTSNDDNPSLLAMTYTTYWKVAQAWKI